MTDKELQALAYAYINQFDPEDRSIEYNFAYPVIEWLAKDYEIVSKEKIKRHHNDCIPFASKEITEENSLDVYLGRKLELEMLFPQTLNTEEK